MARPKSTSEKHPGKERAPVGNGAAESQASYFLSLSLENVRCFGPKQTLELSRNGKPARWTIILGVNGTGKTTLLQSLVGFEVLPPKDSLSEQPSERVRFGRLEHQTFQRSGQQEAFLGVDFAISPSLTAPPALVAKSQVRMCSGGRQVMPIPPQTPSGNDVDSPWCCAYGAGRRIGAPSLSAAGLDDPTANLFSDAFELRNAEDWLLKIDYAAKSDPQLKQRFAARLQQVKRLLLDILPEVKGVRLTTSSNVLPTSWVEFHTPYGWVPLRQLGYGYQTLIAWMVDFASRMVERYPDSRDPLDKPAVVAVDEIDLHLHPEWQRKLISYLTERFPNTQFIATAHSPLVVQAAADANLAVLRREGDHVVIDNDVDNIKNWRIDQILTSDLFGLKTARPPQIEPLLLERGNILQKPKLTAADQRRLKEIEAKIGDLPFGETEQERKEREAIRKTLDLLMKDRQPSQ